ncbi:MAG: 1,4-dihydroxy-2-naphthoate polyprenyltransferase [Deltaproteobacteria bacterium]|nr:1,4-dihydroxy-2-naphthoate polyprenyltransferase [Deltaproteobacteria bacterium]
MGGASKGWGAWLLAARLRTLPVAAAPVAVGAALAVADGQGRVLPAFAALLGAFLIQIGANFANDVFDFERGADTDDRIGPPRAAQLGWLTPRQMKIGTAVAFGSAALVGIYLVGIGGWPIALIGLLSIAAGLAYTGGPFAFGYHGLGDIAVFAFFGIIAVCGTYYVQALSLPPIVLAGSLPIGAFATAVLVVNNLRDVDTDRSAGKRTLAVRFGRRMARFEYAGLLVFAYAMLPVIGRAGGSGAAIALPLLTLPLAVLLIRTVWMSSDGPTLNAALARTAALEVVFAILLAIGLLR